jgi:hypothetical protein
VAYFQLVGLQIPSFTVVKLGNTKYREETFLGWLRHKIEVKFSLCLISTAPWRFISERRYNSTHS